MGYKVLATQQTVGVPVAVGLASLAPGGVIPTNCDHAVIQAEGQQCRYRNDGTAPTTTVGMLLDIGAVGAVGGATGTPGVVVRQAQFSNFQIIQLANNATLTVEFRKTG